MVLLLVIFVACALLALVGGSSSCVDIVVGPCHILLELFSCVMVPCFVMSHGARPLSVHIFLAIHCQNFQDASLSKK